MSVPGAAKRMLVSSLYDFINTVLACMYVDCQRGAQLPGIYALKRLTRLADR